MEEEQRRARLFAAREFWRKCIRVFRVARKPTMEELKQVSRVSALGIAVIGALGFIIGIAVLLLFL